MTNRHVRSPLIASALALGLVTLAPALARAQDISTLPQTGGLITLVGCFWRGEVKGQGKYVLVKPIVGTIASVNEASCSAGPTDQVIKLQDLSQVHLDHGMVGQWLEITGRLESSHSSDGIREVHVKSFKPVPVVPRRVTATTPAPPPIAKFTPVPAPEPIPQPVVEQRQPVATAGVRTELPRTATSLPLFGLIGFVSLGAGLFVHLLNRRLARA
jgi:hypothetical protein